MASSLVEPLRRPVTKRATSARLATRLDEGLEQLGQAASQAQREALLQFLDLLAQWNAVYNLTSVRDPSDMLAVHLLDSLSIVPLVDRCAPASVLDVGSGAGLPGIPLAIMLPALHVFSVDAVAKKIGFQLQAKSTLRLNNFTPLQRRVEALTLADVPGLIVSRAYADLSSMLVSIAHVSGARTRVLAMKGMRPDAEIAAVTAPWRVDDVVDLDVPFLGAQRCAVLIGRVA